MYISFYNIVLIYVIYVFYLLFHLCRISRILISFFFNATFAIICCDLFKLFFLNKICDRPFLISLFQRNFCNDLLWSFFWNVFPICDDLSKLWFLFSMQLIFTMIFQDLYFITPPTFLNIKFVACPFTSSSGMFQTQGQGLGIMIIEGKHAEVGKGIFISDIQEGSAAEQVNGRTKNIFCKKIDIEKKAIFFILRFVWK